MIGFGITKPLVGSGCLTDSTGPSPYAQCKHLGQGDKECMKATEQYPS